MKYTPDEKPVLHGDSGNPLKSANLAALLNILGIQTSYSLPRVSNDNADAEALIHTLKYHPGLPEKPFEDVESTRQWVSGFVNWYNQEHRHSCLNWVTHLKSIAGRTRPFWSEESRSMRKPEAETQEDEFREKPETANL